MQDDLRKHVAVIAYYFPPLGLSGVQRVAKLVKYLPENGWDVTVITPEPSSYFAFDEKLLAEIENTQGVRIHRTKSLDPTRFQGQAGKRIIPFPEESSRKLLSAISQWVLLPDNKIGWKRFAIRDALKLHDRKPFDLIFATAPPYTCFLVGHDVATRLKRPLVLDYRDDWVGNPRHTYPTSWHKRYMAKKERQVVKDTEHIITINEHIAGSIQQRNPEIATRLTVIPHGFDPADFNEESLSPNKEPQIVDSSAKMTFLYAGMFYDAQQPDNFLIGLSRVLNRKPEYRSRVRAKFVGLFPESKKAIIEEYGLWENVELTGYVNHEESVQALQNCDVAWMMVGRQPGEEGISTGKLFEYMGAGKPILGLVPNGTAREALQLYSNARCVFPDHLDQITDAIEQLIAAWSEGNLQIAEPASTDAFNRKKQARNIATLFDQIVA